MSMVSLKSGVRVSVPRTLTTSNTVIAKCSDRTSSAAKTDYYDVVLESFSAVCIDTTATLDVFILSPSGSSQKYLVKALSIAAAAAPYVYSLHNVPLKPGESFIAKASAADKIDISFVLIVGSGEQQLPAPQLGTGYTGGPAIGTVSAYGGTGGPSGTGGGMIRPR